jgi:hypothetical protein
MTTLGLIEFDMLDGASNFLGSSGCKCFWMRLSFGSMLRKRSLHLLIQLAAHVKKEAKANRIILYSVKDHFIPHIAEKTTGGKLMYEALVGLYQSSCVSLDRFF